MPKINAKIITSLFLWDVEKIVPIKFLTLLIEYNDGKFGDSNWKFGRYLSRYSGVLFECLSNRGGIGFVKYRKYPRRRFFQPAISRSTQDIGYTLKNAGQPWSKWTIKHEQLADWAKLLPNFLLGVWNSTLLHRLTSIIHLMQGNCHWFILDLNITSR